MRYIGIDPGQSGAIALLEDGAVEWWKMPATDAKILDLFLSLMEGGPATVTLELVTPMPALREVKDRPATRYLEEFRNGKPTGRRFIVAQGAKSTWTFAGGFFGLRMALTACGFTWNEVRPTDWQRIILGATTRGDKEIAHRWAKREYGESAIKLPKYAADAVALATWGARVTETAKPEVEF